MLFIFTYSMQNGKRKPPTFAPWNKSTRGGLIMRFLCLGFYTNNIFASFQKIKKGNVTVSLLTRGASHKASNSPIRSNFNGSLHWNSIELANSLFSGTRPLSGMLQAERGRWIDDNERFKLPSPIGHTSFCYMCDSGVYIFKSSIIICGVRQI